jgi:hypothetical protein
MNIRTLRMPLGRIDGRAGRAEHAEVFPLRGFSRRHAYERGQISYARLRRISLSLLCVRNFHCRSSRESVETTGRDGILLPEFASPDDHVHGNNAFGTVVLARFGALIAST